MPDPYCAVYKQVVPNMVVVPAVNVYGAESGGAGMISVKPVKRYEVGRRGSVFEAVERW